MNICVGCGVSFESNNPDTRFHDCKCYQKWYHKTYYAQNCDRLKQYGRDYFHKKQSLKSPKPIAVNGVFRVRIVAPQFRTFGLTGTTVPWKARGWEGRGVRVLLDGYKTTSIYHPDFIQYIEED